MTKGDKCYQNNTLKKKYTISIFISCIIVFVSNHTNAQLSKITNGDFWYDTDGNIVDAHAGGLIMVGDTYYWFGESYGDAQQWVNHKFKGIRCYSSKNLSDWKFENIVIKPNAPGFEDCWHMERPKVIYNSTTEKFVLWAHWEAETWGAQEHAVVAYCDKVDGDYTFVKHFWPTDLLKDCSLFRDDDGSAYFIFDNGSHQNIKVAKLTDDYLDIDRIINDDLFNETHREAVALFKRNEIYYLLSSGTTGSDTNQQKYSTSLSILGPWSELKDIGSKDGFNSQTTFVLPVVGTKETTYVYCGDRWNDPGFKDAKHIWIPIKWDKDVPLMDYYENWWIDAEKGKWSSSNNEESE